jgi:hypothetical protein
MGSSRSAARTPTDVLTSVARLRTIRGELRDVIGTGVRAVLELEKATGRRIVLSESIRGRAGA